MGADPGVAASFLDEADYAGCPNLLDASAEEDNSLQGECWVWLQEISRYGRSMERMC